MSVYVKLWPEEGSKYIRNVVNQVCSKTGGEKFLCHFPQPKGIARYIQIDSSVDAQKEFCYELGRCCSPCSWAPGPKCDTNYVVQLTDSYFQTLMKMRLSFRKFSWEWGVTVPGRSGESHLIIAGSGSLQGWRGGGGWAAGLEAVGPDRDRPPPGPGGQIFIPRIYNLSDKGDDMTRHSDIDISTQHEKRMITLNFV